MVVVVVPRKSLQLTRRTTACRKRGRSCTTRLLRGIRDDCLQYLSKARTGDNVPPQDRQGLDQDLRAIVMEQILHYESSERRLP